MATNAELINKVKDWANRADLSDAIVSDFLQFTAKRVNNVLRVPPMETIVSYTNITEEQTTLAIPSDLIEPITLKIVDSAGKVVSVFASKTDSLSFDTQLTAGGYIAKPTYTRIAGDFHLSHPLSSTDDGKVILYYYRVLPKLDATFPDNATNKGTVVLAGATERATQEACDAVSGTFTTSCTLDSYPDSIVGEEVPNWFRDEQDDLLLYGALVELFDYLGNAEDARRWEQKYEYKLEELIKEEHLRKNMGGIITVNLQTGGLI